MPVPCKRDAVDSNDSPTALWQVHSAASDASTCTTDSARKSHGLKIHRPEASIATDEGIPWLSDTAQRLGQLLELPPNWDYAGSPPVGLQAVSHVMRVLVSLYEKHGEDFPAPFTCPVSGGGIQLEWDYASRVLELEFTSTDELLYLMEAPDLENEIVTGTATVNDFGRILALTEWLVS